MNNIEILNGGAIRRRHFLKSLGLATLASLSQFETHSAETDERADDKPALGIIGLGRQGQLLTGRFPELARVAALCDVHQGRLESAVKTVKDTEPRAFADYRELMEHPDLECVAVATPDHWHALMTIGALAAGKHVYLEPPICRTLVECRAMLHAEKQYGKVVQVAHMGRANAAAAAVMRYRKDGGLGQVGSVELWSNPGSGAPACISTETPPKQLDWPMWLGPASKVDYCNELFEGKWRNVPVLGGGLYRERISAQLALLPWLTGIKMTGRWTVRPLGKAEDDVRPEPQSLVFESPKNSVSIMWQFTDDEAHSLGWGMNIIGSKESVWLAGGDAGCAAETKVFRKPTGPTPRGDFEPNHRGNWVNAFNGNGRVTMPLKTAASGLALAIAGRAAWLLNRDVSVDLETLMLGDAESQELAEVDYAAPWKLHGGS